MVNQPTLQVEQLRRELAELERRIAFLEDLVNQHNRINTDQLNMQNAIPPQR